MRFILSYPFQWNHIDDDDCIQFRGRIKFLCFRAVHICWEIRCLAVLRVQGNWKLKCSEVIYFIYHNELRHFKVRDSEFGWLGRCVTVLQFTRKETFWFDLVFWQQQPNAFEWIVFAFAHSFVRHSILYPYWELRTKHWICSLPNNKLNIKMKRKETMFKRHNYTINRNIF